ncbi:alpha-ketoglutarate permease [Escherichia coli]|nr:alpha-ketoglutarate permease [Escherichia coli]
MTCNKCITLELLKNKQQQPTKHRIMAGEIVAWQKAL